MAGRSGPAAGLCLQHRGSGGHHQGGRRERHARGHRQTQHSSDPDDRSRAYSAAGEKFDAGDPGQLQGWRPDSDRQSFEGLASPGGHGCLPRRAGREHRPEDRAEPGGDLCEQGRSRGQRSGEPDHSSRGGLSGSNGRRGQGRGFAFRSGLCGIQERARCHARAHVSRDDGARLRQHGQGDPGPGSRQGGSSVLPYLPLGELQRRAGQGAAK